MAKYNIPKLSRNKYGVVKNADANNYITQSQLMMSSGGGNGSGLSSSQVQSQINDTLADRGYVSYTYLKTINGYSLVGQGDISVTGSGTVDLSNYVTKTELDNAAYATTSYVSDYVNTYAPTPDLSAYATKSYVADYVNTYAPTPDLSAYAKILEMTYQQYSSLSYYDQSTLYVISDDQEQDLSYYVTKVELDETLKTLPSTETEVKSGGNVTVTDNDGIIVLTQSNSVVTFPTTGITDGKTIYIINKTGGSFTISTNGDFVDKESGQASRQSATITDNVQQYIYYDGEWFLI